MEGLLGDNPNNLNNTINNNETEGDSNNNYTSLLQTNLYLNTSYVVMKNTNRNDLDTSKTNDNVQNDLVHKKDYAFGYIFY